MGHKAIEVWLLHTRQALNRLELAGAFDQEGREAQEAYWARARQDVITLFQRHIPVKPPTVPVEIAEL